LKQPIKFLTFNFNLEKEIKMGNKTKAVEGFEEAVYTMEVPGYNKNHVVVKVDTEQNCIRTQLKKDKEEQIVEIEVPIRYDIEKAKVSVKDGIVTITCPTKEGVVKTITDIE